YPLERYCRLHQTSGSGGRAMRWLDTRQSWEWFRGLWRVIYSAAGVGPNDRLMFPFSFGPFIGFWAAFEYAASMGNLVLAAGGMHWKEANGMAEVSVPATGKAVAEGEAGELVRTNLGGWGTRLIGNRTTDGGGVRGSKAG